MIRLIMILENIGLSSAILPFIYSCCVPFQEFQEEIEQHRNPFKEMRDTGHKITEKCSSEEVVYVNDEIEKIEVRWRDLTSTAKKRKQSIEENYEMSSMFFEGAEKLKESFDDVAVRIKSDQSIGKDKTMVRAQIKKHKVSFLQFTLVRLD